MGKLSLQEFSALHRRTAKLILDYKELRIGQSVMNALHEIRPDLYNDVTNNHPEVDCFYDDKKVTDLIMFLTSEPCDLTPINDLLDGK
tara:strand:- start:541 stop:804 length:264 start_codon:yes stop_codon:yes gene_type:complete